MKNELINMRQQTIVIMNLTWVNKVIAGYRKLTENVLNAKPKIIQHQTIKLGCGSCCECIAIHKNLLYCSFATQI